MSQATEAPRYEGNEIAVCGRAGRFPGASDVQAFWRNLCEGRESIVRFTDEELRAAGVGEDQLRDPSYVKARPILEDIEHWDAAFFGVTPREAEVLDPQQRLFLECVQEALEDAACDSERVSGPISVFAGASFSNYLVRNLYGNRPVLDAFGDVQATILNVQDSLVTMAGYKFNLRGACCAVQTFCSTSLVAVHLAAQSLLNYECDVALAGGVTAFVPQRSGYLYQDGGIVSPDGHCRPFGARAGGTVFGSGVGVVVLKRLADALAARDPIRAIIRGTAVNNDGALKVSYAAPGVVGQTEVISEALAAAGVDPATIGYVETHGTGTLLGDPAEMAALTRAYRRKTEAKGFCAIGSVKSNVGHLDAAAGVTGLIKAILCLENARIPPSLHCEEPNPQIDFAQSPFFVSTALRDWPRGPHPRRAGVSAFGVGGTNAHVVLEEAPPVSRPAAKPPSGDRPQLVVLSARTQTALRQARLRLATHLRAHPEVSLADAAFTLQVGRRAFEQRFTLVAADRDTAIARLGSDEAGADSGPLRRNPPVAFVFAADSRPRVGAAWDLFEGHETFRQAVTQCAAAARPWLDGCDLVARLYPGAPPEGGAAPLPGTVGEAALFAVQLGLARLFMAWGVQPEVLAGFGSGELVAACVAEALSLEDALRLTVLRGRLDEEEGESGAGKGDVGAEEGAALGRVQTREPRVPCLSGTTGAWLEQGAPAPPDHWGHVVRAPASSPRALGALRARRDPLVLELRPPQGAEGAAFAPMLEELGRLWRGGVAPDWSAVQAPLEPRRVALPTYPFERQRFWVDPLPKEEVRAVDAPGKVADIARWFYQPVWKGGLASLPRPTITGGEADACLVFADRFGIGGEVARRLREAGGQVTVVESGPAFGGGPAAGYQIDPAQPEHYARLLTELEQRAALPRRLAHLWSVDTDDPALGFWSVLHLLQALGRSRPSGAVDLQVVSSGLHDVLGREALRPEKAPLLGLATVAQQELHPLRCRILDLEAAGLDVRAGAEAVLQEMQAPGPEPVVAYRASRRWTRVFEPWSSAASEGGVPRVRGGGTYLITGGLGNVGFMAAVALARAARVRLVLLGRSELPPREEWEAWLEGHALPEATTLRIKRIRALEAAGSEVMVARADVSDEGEVAQALAAVLVRFGPIDGVVHAAGLLARDDFQPLGALDRAACERMFAPKIRGLLNLDRQLVAPRPDFWLLTSSLSSILGGLGYAAYAGANAFLDQYALHRGRDEPGRWTSVNLDQWNFGGPAAAEAATSINPQEGLPLLEALLRTAAAGQVVVSATPLAERLRRSVDLAEAPQAPRASAAAPGSRRPRPALAVDRLAPRDAGERVVTEIFEELLGVGPLGVHDDFFELGGHSLFAARVLSRLRDAFAVSLPLAAFFDAPTAAGLSAQISARLMARESAAPRVPSADRVEIEI